MNVQLAVRVLGLLVVACSNDDDDGAAEEAVFPVNYADSYVEVRGCRKSGDHSLAAIRVLAEPDAAVSYLDRQTQFSPGAVILKEEYGFGDTDCSDEIAGWTVMMKKPEATASLGWEWQRVSTTRTVTQSNATGCVACHTPCGGVSAETGYDYTCTDP
ncbi:MAG TPA: cytochrome P460 family protein [Polyangiaceae bacterium]|nr:cytochrome P460 family protein [Polyangiaceae bacterium]